MYVGSDFPDMSPNEERRLTLDFVNDLNAGPPAETIDSADWFCEVPPELNTLQDAGAQSHVIGSTIISGTQVIQRISGLLPGVIYRMRCVCATSASCDPELFSHVRCVAPV